MLHKVLALRIFFKKALRATFHARITEQHGGAGLAADWIGTGPAVLYAGQAGVELGLGVEEGWAGIAALPVVEVGLRGAAQAGRGTAADLAPGRTGVAQP
jgi:hypothetical protein